MCKTEYWFAYNYTVGKNDSVLMQVIRCNLSRDLLHVGMTPVYSVEL